MKLYFYAQKQKYKKLTPFSVCIRKKHKNSYHLVYFIHIMIYCLKMLENKNTFISV